MAAIDGKTSESLSEPSPERVVFGRHTIREIAYDDLIVLNQVREGQNPERQRIRESIESDGLINNIDVARLTPESYHAYVAAVGDIYARDKRHIDAPVKPSADGYYYLVISGHTRHGAIGDIIDDTIGRSDGAISKSDFAISCKIYDNPSIEQILATQMAENYHSQPPAERSAMAIVEYYRYGIKNGLWEDKVSFRHKAGKKLPKRIVNDAIAFFDLPSEIRNFVFSGNFKYASAVALSSMAEIKRATLAKQLLDSKMDDNLSDDEWGEIEATLALWLGAEVLHVQNAKLGAEKVRAYVKNKIAAMQRTLDDDPAELTLDALMVDPGDVLRLERESIRSRYRTEMGEASARRIEQASDALAMHHRLYGNSDTAEHDEMLNRHLDRLKVPIGKVAAVSAVRRAS